MYVGKGTASGQVLTFDGTDIAWASPGSAGTNGAETFPLVAASGNEFMTNNTAFGQLYCSAVIPESDVEVANIAFLVAQNAGGGTCGVGVYDQLGILMGYSTLTSPNLGVNLKQLTLDGSRNALAGPLMLSGGALYYFALESNVNSMGPLSIQGSTVYNPPTAPPLSFFIPNSRSVHASGFPSDVSGFFGQTGGDARKYWLLGL